MLVKNILEAIGNTPMIELQRITDENEAKIFVKYEGINVGGSIKTRTALQMIEHAEQEGLLKPGYTIVEATSGNQGIGIALISAIKGYQCKIIMPDSVSEERRKILKQYGAEIILIHDDGDIGKAITECSDKAKEIVLNTKNAYMPNQFANQENVKVHYNQTANEILEDLEGYTIDAFVSGIGTGGTITGIGSHLKQIYPNITIVAAEPIKAAILSGLPIETHIQMGIGDGLIPDILNTDIIDKLALVTDEEAVQMAKRLAMEEGLLCGISSGTNVVVAKRMAKKLGKGHVVVTVLPDTAERYYSTPLFN